MTPTQERLAKSQINLENSWKTRVATFKCSIVKVFLKSPSLLKRESKKVFSFEFCFFVDANSNSH